jgi:hypothetical protein
MASFDDVIVKSVLGSKTATILGLELEHVQSIVEIGAGGHLVSMSTTRRHSSKELKSCGVEIGGLAAKFPRPVDLQDSVLRPECLSFHPAECGPPGTSGPCGCATRPPHSARRARLADGSVLGRSSSGRADIVSVCIVVQSIELTEPVCILPEAEVHIDGGVIDQVGLTIDRRSTSPPSRISKYARKVSSLVKSRSSDMTWCRFLAKSRG